MKRLVIKITRTHDRTARLPTLQAVQHVQGVQETGAVLKKRTRAQKPSSNGCISDQATGMLNTTLDTSPLRFGACFCALAFGTRFGRHDTHTGQKGSDV